MSIRDIILGTDDMSGGAHSKINPSSIILHFNSSVSFAVMMRLFLALYLSCRACSGLFADILLQLQFQLDVLMYQFLRRLYDVNT